MTKRTSSDAELNLDLTAPKAKHQKTSHDHNIPKSYADSLFTEEELEEVPDVDVFHLALTEAEEQYERNKNKNTGDLTYKEPSSVHDEGLTVTALEALGFTQDQEDEFINVIETYCDQIKQSPYYLSCSKFLLYNINVVVAPMGSGKTTALKQFMLENALWSKKVLHITSRKALAKVTVEQNPLLVDYQHIPDKSINSDRFPRLCICVNSIHKIEDIDSYDVVVLDETRSIFNMVTSDICMKSAIFFEKLRNMMKPNSVLFGSNKTFFFMDAMMGKRELEWIRSSCSSTPVNEVKHSLPPQLLPFVEVKMHKDIGSLIRTLVFSVVASKQRVAVVTNCKNTWEKITSLLKIGSAEFKNLFKIDHVYNTMAIKTAMFSSDNMEEFNEFISNQNHHETIPDIIVTTPVMGPGMSFDAFPVDYVIGYFNGVSGSAADSVQMLARYRKNKQRICRVYICDSENSIDLPPLDKFLNNQTKEMLNTLRKYKPSNVSLATFLYSFVGDDEAIQNRFRLIKGELPHHSDEYLTTYFNQVVKELPQQDYKLLENTWETKRKTYKNFKKTFINLVRHNADSIKITAVKNESNTGHIGSRVLDQSLLVADITKEYYYEYFRGSGIKVVCPSVKKCLDYGLFGISGTIIDSSSLKSDFSQILLELPNEHQIDMLMSATSAFTLVHSKKINKIKHDKLKSIHLDLSTEPLYKELFILLGLHEKDDTDCLLAAGNDIEIDPKIWVHHHFELMECLKKHSSHVNKLTSKTVHFYNDEKINGQDISKVRICIRALFNRIGIPIENHKKKDNKGILKSVSTRPNPKTMRSILNERTDRKLELENESKRPSLYQMYISKLKIIKAYDICFRKKYNEVYNLKVRHANLNDDTEFMYDELYCALAEFSGIPFKFIVIDDLPEYDEKFNQVYNYFNKKHEFK